MKICQRKSGRRYQRQSKCKRRDFYFSKRKSMRSVSEILVCSWSEVVIGRADWDLCRLGNSIDSCASDIRVERKWPNRIRTEIDALAKPIWLTASEQSPHRQWPKWCRRRTERSGHGLDAFEPVAQLNLNQWLTSAFSLGGKSWHFHLLLFDSIVSKKCCLDVNHPC